ncbi:gephyrin-like molybdotransferase Glp [Alkalihalobacterium alkalinitrilicum]|uniref:molybdopterin molybdotransferase MoeA n=1 Tax=Alkalihalobacterium alkalinitrilicum TaxID=427920 RepID=UPI000994B246|nr:gephyrin-like molybdotransferase Glp [Alkalihalobacterium alkalinitrilicum]
MIEERKPIDVDEAIHKIVQSAKQGEVETVPLSDAVGRYLAEDIVADHPVPHFDRSSFDGFAIKSEETVNASFENPVYFKVVDRIGAGDTPNRKVNESEAIRIMTGAQMPKGADSVVALEIAIEEIKDGETWIKVNRPIEKNTNVARRGEDIAADAVLAKRGRRISAGEMSILATFGYAQVKVYKQPVIGVFVTGTELLPVDSPLVSGKIRNSNSYMLLGQIKSLGAIPKYLGILPDEYELCYKSVLTALEEVDYLVTTGGASVGDFDFVQDILKELNAKVLFNKVAMRPGSVTTVATWKDKWIFGLSGNPAACYVGFELFARPVLKTALGATKVHLSRSSAIIEHDITMGNPFARFTRAKAEVRGHQVYVSSVGRDKSDIISALIEANVLLYIPARTKKINECEHVTILWLERFEEGLVNE